MANIWCLCPANQEGYQYMLDHISPILDREGISFHIARPGEDILSTILNTVEEVSE